MRNISKIQKKSIEWQLQVQIAFLTEVNLAPAAQNSHTKNMDSRAGQYCQPAEISATIYHKKTLLNLKLSLK